MQKENKQKNTYPLVSNKKKINEIECHPPIKMAVKKEGKKKRTFMDLTQNLNT